MRHRITILILWLAIVTVISCSQEKFQFTTEIFTIGKVYDIGNHDNASDIRANIMLGPRLYLATILEARLVITKASKQLSELEARNLGTGNYFFVFVTSDSTQAIKPGPATKDSDGDAISNDINYKLYMVALGKDGATKLSTPVNFKLTDTPIYAGRYVGTWADNKGASLKQSLIINEDYTGSMYYTPSYLPCCGGQQDATLVMTVNGTQITSFKFAQYLQDYPKGTNGHCPAQGSAIGVFSDDIMLSLNDFSFSDCDGTRTVTVFDFKRQ